MEKGTDGDITYAKYIADTEANTILSEQDFNDFIELIPTQKKKGYQLVDVRYSNTDGKEVWTGEFRNDVIPTTQFYTDSFDEFKIHAAKQLEQGKDLINLEHGDGNILATYANSPTIGGYLSNKNLEKFGNSVYKNTVLDAFNSGPTDLVDYEYIEDNHVAVTKRFTGASNYAINYQDYDQFKTAIESQIEKGKGYGQDFALVDVEYVNGAWSGVVNDNNETVSLISQDYAAVPDSLLAQARMSGEAFSFDTFVLPNL